MSEKIDGSSVRPAILVILDGFGINPHTDEPGNAIKMANTPTFDRLFQEYPRTRLHTSGEAVGLPAGIMGNSEIGHMNLGSGRVIYSDIVRIDKSLSDGSFRENPVFQKMLQKAAESNGRIHLMGLLSDGGVHSSQDHLEKILKILKEEAPDRDTWVHAILDGRDTSPTSGVHFLKRLLNFMGALGYGKLADIIGRYYAMDRDNRWDRVEKAYRLFSEGKGVLSENPEKTVAEYYENDITDEFMEPISLDPDGVIQDGDVVLFFNFRSDRARQITEAIALPAFDRFPRSHKLDVFYACMTEYKKEFDLPVLFPPQPMANLFGEVVSEHGLRQLRIAETEKYAHVTFFFNGGREEPYPHEDRILVPSPKVATYDLQPEMSARPVCDRVVEALARKENGHPYYSLVVLNFANGDMVGHTGDLDAAIRAVEVLDEVVGRVEQAVLENGYAMFLTADHGNCEKMCADPAEDGCKPFTQHTLFPVPLIYISEQSRARDIPMKEGKLADVAPTMLTVMGIPVPAEMTGEILFSAQTEALRGR